MPDEVLYLIANWTMYKALQHYLPSLQFKMCASFTISAIMERFQLKYGTSISDIKP